MYSTYVSYFFVCNEKIYQNENRLKRRRKGFIITLARPCPNIYIYTHTVRSFVCMCVNDPCGDFFFCLVPERRQTTEFSHPSLKGLSPLLRPCRLMMMTQYKKERKKEKREKNALLLPLDQSLHVAEERGVTECIASFWEGGGKGGWERLHYQ